MEQMLSARLLPALLFLLLASACSPIKAYPGPELPDSQVALVSRSCFWNRGSFKNAAVDGTTFCFRSIAVLPGRHIVTADREQSGAPFNCTWTREFDSYGYSSCRNSREEDIRKGNSPRECYESSYWKDVQYCDVTHYTYGCQLQTDLLAGIRYVLEPLGADSLQLMGSAGIPKACACTFSGSRTEREKQ